jgi:hypothetical protein
MPSPYGAISDANRSVDFDEHRLVFSVGRVVDTNDPTQMGRLRVYVPGLDHPECLVGDIPWAIYCSPFAGHTQKLPRGPEEDYTGGPVAYGMFAIPKVGTDVIVGNINGDPNIRIWFGALYGMYLTDTMPHGRFLFGQNGELDGPLSSSEQPIQPTYNNLTTAWTRTTAVASNDGGAGLPPRTNFEWRVRGVDYQAAALGIIQKNQPNQVISKEADDQGVQFEEEDGTEFHQGNFTQGYAQSQIEPNLTYDTKLVATGVNYDPQTYSITTPGFHAISMDDRPENTRIRMRTTSGHQIILDDTNERIYISTVDGNNWIEMDQSGNIDVYAARRVSIHSAMDVNITCDGTFRVNAKNGIHLDSETEVRVTAKADTHIRSYGSTRIKSNEFTNLASGSDTNVQSSGNLNLQSESDTNINTGGTGAWTTSSSLNLNAGGNILQTAAQIHMNGPEASTASDAAPSGANDAYFTNRVPEHEPWGRIMMSQQSTDNNSNNQFTLELSYTDPKVGRYELGETIQRNPKWHR